MAATPEGLQTLNIDLEKNRLQAAIEGLAKRKLVELTWLEGQGWRELLEAIRSGPWHVFHFIGHGYYDADVKEGFVALTDEAGQPYPLSATSLGRVLNGDGSLRLALLNSCEGAKGGEHDIFSSIASILLRRSIPAVVAMQYQITDQAATEFSRSFYQTLAEGFPVDAAVTEARRAISLALPHGIEWGIPTLYLRSPNGVLFNIQQLPETDETKSTSMQKSELTEIPTKPRPKRGESKVPISRLSVQLRDITKEDVYLVMLKDYGVGYSALEVEYAIDSDGSALVQRTVEVEAFSEIADLDTFLLIPELASAVDPDRVIASINARRVLKKSAHGPGPNSRENAFSGRVGPLATSSFAPGVCPHARTPHSRDASV